MTEAAEVAETLGVREAELRDAVDEDTTVATVLGRFTPDAPFTEAKAAVEAWLSGETVSPSNENSPVDDAENPSEGKDNHTETHDGDGTADDGEPASAPASSDMSGYHPACEGEEDYRPDCDTDGLPSHRELLEAAQARAGREPWEPVEEAALRTVLEEHGLGSLLDTGALATAAEWRAADLSGDDEPADRRYYFPSGDEPRPDEFRRFDRLLREAAPADYTPHYFRVARAGKDPATQYGSWKRPEARLTAEEAVEWMEQGGNVGLAGRGGCRGCGGRGSAFCEVCEGGGCDDALVNVDIDDDEATTPDDVPTSLRARSRSRTGWHTWYFDDGAGTDDAIPNIPTDEYGEIRTAWQYVVAPGSFVASAAEEVPDDVTDPGYYTVEDAEPVARIGYDDLPDVFHEAAEAADEPDGDDVTDDGTSATGTDTADLDLGDDDLPDSRSGVFDINASELVTTSDASDRFGSIFHDSKTDANMSVSNGKLHCWRHNVAHGGLQALATLSDKTNHGCKKLGKGHSESGVGKCSLKGDWELVWAAWHYAKANKHLPDDDPLPYRVLLGLALEGGVVEDSEAFVDRDRDTGRIVAEPDEHDGEAYTALPSGTYNDALEYAAQQADVPLGRDPVDTGDSDAEPVAALPLGRLEALDDAEARRFARQRGVDWPDTDEVRDLLRATVYDSMSAGVNAVVDAPTSAGKSHLISTTPWRDLDPDITAGAPVLHLHETKDARNEQFAASQTADDVECRCLLSGPEACAVAGGRHDPETVADVEEDRQVVTVDGEPASAWFRKMTRERGLPFSVAHARARDENDQGLPELPCAPGEQACHSAAQWAGVPRDDDRNATADVIHATHQFAHVPSLRQSVNVVFDERPDFAADLSDERARRAVTAFLQESDSGPDTWEKLVATAEAFDGNPYDKADPDNEHAAPDERATYDARDDFMGCVEALEYDPDTEWYFGNPDAHTLAQPVARAVFRALIEADPFDANGRASHTVAHNPPRFDDDANDGDFWNREWISVVIDDTFSLRRVRSTPDFSGARSVIGLDARPKMRPWQQNTAPGMTRVRVLEPEERRLWRVFERGLRIVQVGEAVRPNGSGGRYYDRDGDAALVEAIRDRFGDLRSGVVPKAAEADFRELLETAGADEPDVLTYGREKSRNTLAGESVGMVSHSLDPGDEHLLDWLAECGLDATPERTTCGTCDGTGDVDGDRCEACDGDGQHREHGRGFDGPDADAAGEFLATVRENHLVQSAGRYARNPGNPDDSAVVFVRSAALPEQYVDLKVPGVEWVATDRQKRVVEALQAREHATADEVADAAEVSKEHVRTTLRRLLEADEQLVEVRERAGEHGAHLYRALAGLGTEPGVVDMGDETANGHVWQSNTWSLAVSGGATLPAPVDGPTQPSPLCWRASDGDNAAEVEGDPPPGPGG